MEFFSDWHVAQGMWVLLALLGMGGATIGVFLSLEQVFKRDE